MPIFVSSVMHILYVDNVERVTYSAQWNTPLVFHLHFKLFPKAGKYGGKIAVRCRQVFTLEKLHTMRL